MNQQLEELRRWISSLQIKRGRLFEDRSRVAIETKEAAIENQSQDD